MAMSKAPQHRQDDQFDRNGQAQQYVFENRATAENRLAPIPLHELLEPDDVLDVHGFVQAVLLA